MKNFFKITVLAAIFCMVASCENSIGKRDLEDGGGDLTDSGMSDEDADSGDSTDADETDATTDEDGNIPDETDDDITDTTDEDNDDIVDSDSEESDYHSPYGSIVFNFENNLIGSEEEPTVFSDKIFASGCYGNGTEEIAPEYAEKIETMAFVHNDYIEIQQTLTYSDGTVGNPTVFLYLPLETAQNPGIYTLALSGDAAIILADVNWSMGQIQCYHAFGAGQIEISESNINELFQTVTFSGNATLYHPLNYNGEDVSAEFLQTFTGTNMLCGPVD